MRGRRFRQYTRNLDPRTRPTRDIADIGNALAQAAADFSPEVGALRQMPFVNDCWVYDPYDADVGCLHDVNAISLAFFSHVKGADYTAALNLEKRSMLDGGQWYFWEESPPNYWAYHKLEDFGHLSWMALSMLLSPDARVRSHGQNAADWIARHWDGSQDQWAHYAVAGALVLGGHKDRGCAMASKLPAASYLDGNNQPSIKSAQWASYVYTLAQTRCPV